MMIGEVGPLQASPGHAGLQPRTPAQRARWVASNALVVLALVVLPVLVYLVALPSYGDDAGFDLRQSYLPAAERVLDGGSPFPSLDDVAALERYAYVYPPLLAFLASPLTLVGGDAASVIGVALFLALLAATLWITGVRDWRCYGVVLLWAPTFNAVQNLNVSLPLAFGVAAVWCLRRRALAAGAVLGLLVGVKLFLWPLIGWLLAVRRPRAALVATVVAPALVVASWAAIGFDGLAGYRDLLARFTELNETDSYAISGALTALGAPEPAGRVVAVAVTGALLALGVRFARRGDELRAFTSFLAAALALPPILWQHYLLVLLVPLAVSRPRLSAAWLLPLVLWLAPQTENGDWWQTLLVPAVAAGLTVAVLAPAGSLRLRLPWVAPARTAMPR
jgi:alpha-1,2-mannosyltransferase